ncbi:MAG: hypothetical protein DCC57_20450, partial [Chloroflexi bacterium]
GPLTIWPALQNFLVEVAGVALLGRPNWSAAGVWMPPLGVIQAVQMAAMAAGTAGALAVAWRAARRSQTDVRAAWLEIAPWALILLALAAAAVWVFLLPMEMRGNVLAYSAIYSGS